MQERDDEPQLPPEALDQTPFPITSVCRADLAQVIDPNNVPKFTDDDMEYLAGKMADSYVGNGEFWMALEIFAEDILERKGREGVDRE